MKRLRFYLALWAAKLSIIALKITRHNGTNFPGIVALKICPDFLWQVKKPARVIGITGTNGKTTVCNLAIDMFKADGIAVLNNSLGSNIHTGLATSFVLGTGIFGGLKYDTAVLEMDERSAPLTFPAIKPDWLLINNLTRDSIMRNGHPEYIARILTEEMPSATKLLLNGDDLIASSIAPDNERKYFGIKSLDTDVTDCINLVNDLRICPRCSSLLKYTQRRYHHIGKAYCPACGFKSPQCDYEGQNADLEQMTIEIAERDGSVFCYRLLNDSVFNIYNVVAIVALFRELGYSRERIAELLQKIEIVKSRFDVKELGDFRIIKQMSKGTQEKVQLILVMSRRAKLYLLDEPIGGVDPATRDFILATILHNFDGDSSILISTHLISDVEKALDDVVFINNGRVLLTSSVDDIREKNGMSVDALFREVFKC